MRRRTAFRHATQINKKMVPPVKDTNNSLPRMQATSGNFDELEHSDEEISEKVSRK